jgi:ubiquinone/menaquinone biosynthesis C-methylase UbiE
MNNPVGGRFVIPNVVVSQFHLREGDIVADFGAGSGFFLTALHDAVGDPGKIYACEIQKSLVDKLGDTARLAGLDNVQPLWCDLEEENGIKIATGELDAAFLINALFQIEDKETGIKEMGRTVRRGGKFIVIDWTESFSGMGPAPDHVITAEECKVLLESHGFIFERDFPAGEHHYGLAFKKV